MAMPCSVKTRGAYRRPPRPLFEVAVCDLKPSTSSRVKKSQIVQEKVSGTSTATHFRPTGFRSSSAHTRTGRPRARKTGAAICCSCTTTRTFSEKDSAASFRRRCSFAAMSRAISGLRVSILSIWLPDCGEPALSNVWRSPYSFQCLTLTV